MRRKNREKEGVGLVNGVSSTDVLESNQKASKRLKNQEDTSSRPLVKLTNSVPSTMLLKFMKKSEGLRGKANRV